jgi:hypothetical protein
VKKFLIFTIFLILPLTSIKAEERVIDSSFYRWTVYEIQENELGYKKCYIASYPISSDSNHNSRQRPRLMITRFQKDRSEEISVFGGFEYKLGGEIFLMVDERLFKMETKGDMAWSVTKYGDVTMIEAILNSAILRIRSNSSFGTYAIDEYSLKGITRAYARMKQICR